MDFEFYTKHAIDLYTLGKNYVVNNTEVLYLVGVGLTVLAVDIGIDISKKLNKKSKSIDDKLH